MKNSRKTFGSWISEQWDKRYEEDSFFANLFSLIFWAVVLGMVLTLL